MNETEKKQFLAHWEKVRRKGILWYALPTAVAWGTTGAVVIRFFSTLFDQGISPDILAHAFYSQEFLRFWGVFLAGGLCYGLTMWLYYGWLYRRYRAQAAKQME